MNEWSTNSCFGPQFWNLEGTELPGIGFAGPGLFLFALFDSNIDSFGTLESKSEDKVKTEGGVPAGTQHSHEMKEERGLLSVGMTVGLLAGRSEDFRYIAGTHQFLRVASFKSKPPSYCILNLESHKPLAKYPKYVL